MWHLAFGDPVGRRKGAHVGEVWCIASPPYTSASRSPYAAVATTLVVSGGADGFVRVWDRDLNCIGAYAFPSVDLSSGNPENVFWAIHALSCVEIRDSSLRVALTTKDCRMFTFALPGAGHTSTTRLVQEAHHSRELCALAPHPLDSDLFATGGDDSTLRVWRVSNLCILEKRQLPTMCRAVCWSPDGNLIAVGLGGGSPNPEERRLDGSWVVFRVDNGRNGAGGNGGAQEDVDSSDDDDAPTGPLGSRGRKNKKKRKRKKKKKKKKMEKNEEEERGSKRDDFVLRVEYHGRDATQYVTAIAFSPDAKFLAVGSLDTRISVYDVVRGYIRRSVCTEFNGFVSHFDWSLDSTYLRANSGFFELSFYHVCGDKLDATGDCNDGDDALTLTPKEARDIVWATATCVLSWSNLGVWPTDRSASNINTADLAISKQCFGKGIGKPDTGLIAAGQDDGVIRLYRYPAPNRAAKPLALIGHAPHISAVRWTTDESLLLSTGASDKCIMVWDVKDEDDPIGE
jgi:WD40 repeat protein